MTTTQLELRAALPKIDIGDPAYHFLRDRLHLRLRDVMLLMIALNVIRVLIIPAVHHTALGGTFLNEMSPTDIQLILISLVTQPAILYVYWGLVNFIPEAFISMVVKGVIRPKTGKTAGVFLVELEKKMTAPWLSWLALGVALATMIAFQIIGWSTARFRGPFGAYPYNDFEQYVVESAYGLLRFWFLNWAILRIMLFVNALRAWWNEFEADVKPLHPDKAGGFSAIGDATLYGGLMLGAVGLFLMTNILVEVQRGGLAELGVLFGLLTLAILVSPYAFFMPIWSTHKAMERERLRQLNRLSEQYNTLWNKIGSGEIQPDKDQLAQLETLEKLQATATRIVPIWPIAREDLGRFGITLAPIWTVTVSFIVQAVLSGFFQK